MLGGYQPTQGLQGMGCGIDQSCGCGMGDLLSPSTWGPSDWLVMAGVALVGWQFFKDNTPKQRYARKVRRRLGVE